MTGWEVTFSKQFIEQPGNLCKSKKYVTKLDDEFSQIGTFEIPKEWLFRHSHPTKDLIFAGEVLSKDDKKVASLQMIRGQQVVQKRLEGYSTFYTDAYFASPNPWWEEKYLFVCEKTIEAANTYLETFGEKYDGMGNPVIGIYDFAKDKIDFLDVDNYYPMSPSFLNDSTLVLQVYPKNEIKLGIIYCLNRPTQVALLDIATKTVTVISDASKSSRSPRIVNGLVYFLQGPLYYSHFPAADVMCYDPVSKQVTTVAKEVFEEILSSHISAADLVMNPIVKITQEIRTNSATCEKDAELLAVHGEYYFYEKSSVKEFPSLHVGNLKSAQTKCIFEQPPLESMKAVEIEAINMSPISDALLYKKPGNKRLIVAPHGGPNSKVKDVFCDEINYYLSCGYDYVRINYTGSVGYSQAAIEKLVIGQHEIEDTYQAALKLKPRYDDIVVYGGSHGGFIIATLLGKYPTLFAAAAVMNPVIDLPSMAVSTDITDWVFGQMQLPFDLNSLFNAETLQKLSEATPARFAKDIQAPILLLLGLKDRRVHHTQGLFWKKLCNGKDFSLRLYDDADHSLDSEKSNFDLPIQIASFFDEKLKK